jgi:hypothetical protein
VGPLLLLLLQDPRCGHQQPLGVPDPQPCFVPNRIGSDGPQPLFEVPQSLSFPSFLPSSFGASRFLEETATGFLPVSLQPYQNIPLFPQPHHVPIQDVPMLLQKSLVPSPPGRNRSSSIATLDSLRPKNQRSTVLNKTPADLPFADPFLGVLALLSTPKSQPTFLGKPYY